MTSSFSTWSFTAAKEESAPDGSRVWPMLRSATGSMARFALPAKCTSTRVVHKTVNELWYVLEGAGELWRRDAAGESIVELKVGVGVDIPCGVAFQFRASELGLVILGVTMPPWPGDDEAALVEGSTW